LLGSMLLQRTRRCTTLHCCGPSPSLRIKKAGRMLADAMGTVRVVDINSPELTSIKKGTSMSDVLEQQTSR
jgi:hypothetical protein